MLGIGLKEAKTNADNLLEDLEIILEIDNENLAKDFFEKAHQVGVIVN